MSTHPDPEQLSAYIDGELTGLDRDDLEQHLTGCSECSATLRGLRATVADMRALPAPVPSEQDLWALRSAISKARRKPAERYKRFVAAASGLAAAIVVIAVLSVISRTTSSTFSHTGADVYNGPAAAPQAAPNPPPVILTDATNYNSTSAKGLLTSVADLAPSSTAVQPSPGTNTFGGTSSTGSERKTVAGSLQLTYSSRIAACERDIFSSGSGGARALAYIVGRYESTPAFFLIYSVVVSGKTKTEMWVVRQSDCYIRLFLAPQ